MAVALRLQRTGKPKQAHYRVVAIDKRRGPHGEPIEVLGFYNPRAQKDKQRVHLDVPRVERWIQVGAKPSDTVESLLKLAKKGEAAS